MQLERILHSQGFGSRKECRALVRQGLVAVEGAVCNDPFAEFPAPGLVFAVDGEPWTYRAQAYLMLHKPAGYECSHAPRHHPGVYGLLPAPLVVRGVQSVGRLDEDATGLLLFSDDGQFIHALSSGKRKVPKVYLVDTAEPLSAQQIETLLAGVMLHDEPQPVAAADCRREGESRLRLTITEGKYHMVKRMIAAAGNHVAALHRVQVGDYQLPDDLAAGQWAWIEPPGAA